MKRLLALTVIIVLIIPHVAMAQESLTETYSGEFITFQYPANWVVVADEYGNVDLSNTQAGVEAENIFEVPAGSIKLEMSVFAAFEKLTIEADSPEFLVGFTSGMLYMVGFFMTFFADETAEIVIGEVEPFGDGGVSVAIVVGESLSTEVLVIVLANEAIIIAEAPTGELEQWRATLYTIAESVTVNK